MVISFSRSSKLRRYSWALVLPAESKRVYSMHESGLLVLLFVHPRMNTNVYSIAIVKVGVNQRESSLFNVISMYIVYSSFSFHTPLERTRGYTYLSHRGISFLARCSLRGSPVRLTSSLLRVLIREEMRALLKQLLMQLDAA